MSEQSNNIIIGIDGGGTGCRVAIATRQGVQIGTAKGGPANPTFKPKEAISNILAAIEAARLDAGLDAETIASASLFAGLAGIRDDAIADVVTAALPVKQARVVEDTITTVTGALTGGDGAVAAIGTGSFLAHTAAGDTQYIGGWGFRLGDQSSGAWLGHQLLRQVILCVEGLEVHTSLTQAALARFDGDANKVFDFSNTAAPADFGKLAPLVIDALPDGDTVATTLMKAGADYITKALGALDFQADTPLCLVGGLGPHYAAFLPPPLRANVIQAKGTALDGALLLAAKMEATS